MTAQDQGLDRQEQRLDSQYHRVNQPSRVDGVESERAERAYVGILQRVVVAGIGIGNATAALGQIIELTLIERLHDDGDRSGPRHLSDVDELVGWLYLTAGDDVLNLGHHHRNDGPGFG